MRRRLTTCIAVTAALTGVSATPGDAAPQGPGRSAWIDVSVATLWTEPDINRPVDFPASRNPAKPGRWLRTMTLTERKWLYGHLETQAVYGDRVTVLATSGSWSKVAVAGQPSPRHRSGYPGWLPSAQLTDSAPVAAPRTATVKRRSVKVFHDAALTRRAMRLSYGTRLPVTARNRDAVELVDLDGEPIYVARKAVRLRGGDAAPRPVTGKALVRQARKFLGVQYLWGGTSGFGYDCSGFTHEVYGQFGITIPRDAGPQFDAGVPVPRTRLRRGDLLFFANSTGVHHVGMYVGRNRMIHSPRTGQPVQISSLAERTWAAEYAGARRFR